MLVDWLLKSYRRQEKKYPKLKRRKILISMRLSKALEEKELISEFKEVTRVYDGKKVVELKKTGKIKNPNGHFDYWTHPEELYNVRDSDIFWDEIGKDLPAGEFAKTPKELKQVFSHLRKRGNRLFANTQCYEDIDIAFRRQVGRAYYVEKKMGSSDVSASLPPPRHIWGLITMKRFDPRYIEHTQDPLKRQEMPDLSIVPYFRFIRRKYIEMYDTTAELPPYQPTSLREEVLTCREGKNCKKKNADGSPHMVVGHVRV